MNSFICKKRAERVFISMLIEPSIFIQALRAIQWVNFRLEKQEAYVLQ